MAELDGVEYEVGTTDVPDGSSTPIVRRQVQNEMAGEAPAPGGLDRAGEMTEEIANRLDWENTPARTADQQLPDAGTPAPLFSASDIGDLRSRWSSVQAEFVDEPRRAVEQADALVATVMQRLTDGFARERGSLERQWEMGENASTEELRVAIQRYRVFFNKLLNAA